MNTPRGRDGPGTSERGRGSPAKLSSTPRPTQRTSELVYSHDTRLPDSKETGSAGISGELAHPAGGLVAPLVLPGDGFPVTPVPQSGEEPGPAAAEPECAVPSAGAGGDLGGVPPGAVVYDSGWEDCSGMAIRVVFTAGPPNGYLRDWVRDLALRPSRLAGTDSEDLR